MKTSIFFFALATIFSPLCQTAWGDLFIEVSQVGNDVVVTSGGTVDTTALVLGSTEFFGGALQPAFNADPTANANFTTGFPFEFNSSNQPVELYFNPNSEPVTGPSSFGSGTFSSFPDTGSGDVHGFAANPLNPILGHAPYIAVPQGYVSGDFLSSEMTFDDSSFVSLGLTEGIYNWSFAGNEVTLVIVVPLGLPPTLGDCNIDGVVDFMDIAPFIEILSSGSFLDEADCNQDGEVNFLDIGPFISILFGN